MLKRKNLMSRARSRIVKKYHKERAGVEDLMDTDVGSDVRLHPDSHSEYGLLKNPFVEKNLFKKTKYDWSIRNPDRTFGFVVEKAKVVSCGE